MEERRLGAGYWIFQGGLFLILFGIGWLAYMFWTWGGWWIVLSVILALLFLQNLIALPIRIGQHLAMVRRWNSDG